MDNTIRGAASDVAQVDDGGLSWIEVMPIAEKAKNGNDKFTITADDLSTAASYIKANPQRIPVDYDHEGADGGSTRAAGWFTGNAEVRGSSLWAEVKWTPGAVQEIRDGVFRFISPEWTMQSRDANSGLWTKFKKLVAATLTNRPYFEEMTPVTARQLLDSADLEGLDKKFGEGASRLLLAAGESALTAQQIQTLLAADPAPSGDDQPTGDQVDLPELAKSIGLAEDADEDAIKAKLAELTKPDEKPAPEIEAEKDEEVTDYLKALKLDADSPTDVKVAKALNQKDEKLVAQTQEISDLKAKLAESDKLNERIADLEQRDRKRDIDVLLAKAVENGQIMPAEKEAMAELFEENVPGLKKLIATRPAGAFAKRAVGSGKDIERFADDVEVAELVKHETSMMDRNHPVPVDTESGKAHLRAVKILTEKGVKASDDNYTDEYIAAVNQAERELAVA